MLFGKGQRKGQRALKKGQRLEKRTKGTGKDRRDKEDKEDREGQRRTENFSSDIEVLKCCAIGLKR